MDRSQQTQKIDEVQNFLDRAYWIVGTFTFFWSLTAIVCIYRRRALELPIFGEVQISEAIIFTQLAFCLLLPLLLFIVAVYRGTAQLRGWPSRFPGVPTDELKIPKSFNWLRVFVFIALVGVPVFTMQLCYQRMVSKLQIRWVGHPDSFITGQQLFQFHPTIPGAPTNTNVDLRWWGEDKAEPPKDNRAEITAFVGWQPWIYRLVAYGGFFCFSWFLLVPAGMARWSMLRRR